MSGLISARPSQSAIRLTVGGGLLLLIQSGLLLLLPSLDPQARLLILVLSPIEAIALATAAIGLPDPRSNRWRPRDER